MKPIAIPVAILYVNGIAIIVKNAGTAISNRFHSILFKDETINTPTIIKAGAVTAEVITDNTGEKNKASKNNTPVTIAANPVRAPAATPALDSIYEVVVDVPKIAPVTVAKESANKALPARGNLFSFISPAWFATATNVPAVSKKSTNKKVSTTIKNGSVNKEPGSLKIGSNAAWSYPGLRHAGWLQLRQ